MKTLSLIIVSLAILGIAGAASAYAQVTDPIEAEIPFSFTVRNTTLPAGKYTLRRLEMSSGVMAIRNDSGERPVLFLIESAQMTRAPRKSELIFDRVGDQYFLSKIFEVGNNVGAELPRSRAERRLEKEGVRIQTDFAVVSAEPAINAQN